MELEKVDSGRNRQSKNMNLTRWILFPSVWKCLQHGFVFYIHIRHNHLKEVLVNITSLHIRLCSRLLLLRAGFYYFVLVTLITILVYSYIFLSDCDERLESFFPVKLFGYDNKLAKSDSISTFRLFHYKIQWVKILF